jgi:hypothetical protein
LLADESGDKVEYEDSEGIKRDAPTLIAIPTTTNLNPSLLFTCNLQELPKLSITS